MWLSERALGHPHTKRNRRGTDGWTRGSRRPGSVAHTHHHLVGSGACGPGAWKGTGDRLRLLQPCCWHPRPPWLGAALCRSGLVAEGQLDPESAALVLSPRFSPRGLPVACTSPSPSLFTSLSQWTLDVASPAASLPAGRPASPRAEQGVAGLHVARLGSQACAAAACGTQE